MTESTNRSIRTMERRTQNQDESPPLDVQNGRHFQDDILSNHEPLKLSCMRLPNINSTAGNDDWSCYATDSAAALVQQANKDLNSNGNSFSAEELLLPAPDGSINNSNDKNTSSVIRDLDVVVDNNHDQSSSSSIRSKKPGPVSRPTGISSTTRQKLKPLVLPPNDHVVLIVDDNIVNQKIIAKMLTHFQVEYRIASNGQEAVNFFVKEQSRNIHTHRADLPRFAFVLMDLSMPVKDGYEAIAELRTNGVRVPIVALTANALQKERDRASAVGATDFQTKPILRADLYAVCKGYLLATPHEKKGTTRTTT